VADVLSTGARRVMIELDPVNPATLRQHAAVSIAFTVTSIFDVEIVDHGLGGWRLTERRVAAYVKDYDALEPPNFAERWDTSAWALLAAVEDERRVGGAVVAVRTPGLVLHEGRDDLAALLDMRVDPTLRGRGLGGQLILAACAWAKAQRCRQLKIETQNVNVPACRFYARQGCELKPSTRTPIPSRRTRCSYSGIATCDRDGAR
jgi:GNAT superfamily N-acetyltransferase